MSMSNQPHNADAAAATSPDLTTATRHIGNQEREDDAGPTEDSTQGGSSLPRSEINPQHAQASLDDSATPPAFTSSYQPGQGLHSLGQDGAPTSTLNESQGARAPGGDGTDQEWPLKSMLWPPLSETPVSVKILMQDHNGPCSFLALCNVLLLRGDIQLPPNARTAKYSDLAPLLADYLLRASSATPATSPILPTNALDFALGILPKTLQGLDVNVNFVDGTFLRSQGAAEGELELFQLAKVPIKHGWLASQDDPETWEVITTVAPDYDTAAAKAVEADTLLPANSDSDPDRAQVDELAKQLSELDQDPDKQAQLYQATILRRFLDATSTQLTYAGLFKLSEIVAPHSLCALFRNSHFSVLYRRPDNIPSAFSLPNLPQATLFQLVTDQALLHEPSAVWESLEDIDGAASRFYDSGLQPARIRQDYVAREARGSAEVRRTEQVNDADMALAAQLQQDEYERDEHYREQERIQQQRQRQQQYQHQHPQQQPQAASVGGRDPEHLDPKLLTGLGVKPQRPKDSKDKKEKDSKKKKDCIIC